jgi:hypothetical protein
MMNSNCGNELRKPKTRLYNHLSNLGVFQYPVEGIRDGSPISRKNLEVRRGFSPFYIDPTTQELVFVGGVPLTFEDYINEDLRNTIATDYSMNFSEDTKIVSFIYPKYERPYVEFNEEVLEKLERFGYAYLTPIVPPQEEDINPELPEDFLEEFTPNLQVEDSDLSRQEKTLDLINPGVADLEDTEEFKKVVSLEKFAKEIYPLSYEISEEERQARFEDFLKNNQNISRDDAEDYFNQCMI